MTQRPHNDIARKQPCQHQARQDPGNEQLGDRHISGNAVDDHDNGRRYEQTQRARTRQGADHNVIGIAALLQLRQGHFADRGAGGRTRSRHRRKNSATHHIGV